MHVHAQCSERFCLSSASFLWPYMFSMHGYIQTQHANTHKVPARDVVRDGELFLFNFSSVKKRGQEDSRSIFLRPTKKRYCATVRMSTESESRDSSDPLYPLLIFFKSQVYFIYMANRFLHQSTSQRSRHYKR